ncbi:MAG: hypothetical protein M0C28_07975 [Candidatus Moduliflexus flocculans]|nr:hypothetical protein [Candidatus Moduliflexus flocculans]
MMGTPDLLGNLRHLRLSTRPNRCESERGHRRGRIHTAYVIGNRVDAELARPNQHLRSRPARNRDRLPGLSRSRPRPWPKSSFPTRSSSSRRRNGAAGSGFVSR